MSNLPKVIKAFSVYKVGEFVKDTTSLEWRAKMIAKGYLAPPAASTAKTPIEVEYAKPEPVVVPDPEPVAEAKPEDEPKTDRPNLRKRKTEPVE